MVFARFATLVTLAGLASSVLAAPQIHPSVHRKLRQDGKVDLIVTLKQGTDSVVNSVKEAGFEDRTAKIQALVTSLEAHAMVSQAELFNVVSKEATGLFEKVESFWISNQVHFQGATIELVEKLASVSSIQEIREVEIFPLPEIVVEGNTTQSAITPLANEWGITKVQADQAWAAGVKGEGIIVGLVDTGARHTHRALKANWLGDFGWFDPGTKKTLPFDDNGHGSHTTGTSAGIDGIGVAPSAKWSMCRGCRTSGCSSADLLSCGQFFTCPTDPTGAKKDCSKAPRVINNSWGGGQGTTFYANVIKAWRTAGIIPVFANGNSGAQGCGSANSPADDPNVISVGNTNSNDGLSASSSRGPSVKGLLRPEISAPGSSVRSSWYTSDSAYSTISGTSMAAPHVTGAVALLLSKNPKLTYDEVRKILIESVDTKTLQATGLKCGNTKDGVFPNNMFGYGRLNAFSAVKKL